MSRARWMAGFVATIGCWAVVCPSTSAQAPRAIGNSIGMKLVLIPQGTFTMGSPVDEEGRDADERQHEVTITNAFYLGAMEVTQGQYEQVMGSNPSSFPEGRDGSVYPVDRVSWDEAVEFCKRLSALPAEQVAGRVYRLPTEAEWEYACRAGTRTPYGFAEDGELLGDHAWFDGNSDEEPHPVGVKKANAWLLHDMHGNVEEWCSDRDAEYPGGAVKDPGGPVESSSLGRVVRGGGWGSLARQCRSAERSRHDPSTGDTALGFRVVSSPVVWAARGPDHIPVDAAAGSLVGSGDPRWQLYRARLDRLQFVMEQPSQRHRAAEWLAEAAEAWMAIAGAFPDDRPGLPIELRVHGANLDRAMVVLDSVEHRAPRKIAFSPDGSRVAVSRDGKVLVFSPDGGRPTAVFDGGTADVRSLRYSADGGRIVMTSDDNTLRLLDPDDGRLVASIDRVGPAETNVASSPDGTSLLVAVGDEARLVDTATGALVRTFRGHAGKIESVAFSPDASRVAAASADRTARLWDSSGGDALAVLELAGGRSAAIAFSPDSTRLVALDAMPARLWDARDGALVATLKVGDWRAEKALYSPDGAVLAVECDRRVSLLDGRSGEVRVDEAGEKLRGDVLTVFSPDGSRMVTTRGAVATQAPRSSRILRETATGRILGEFVGAEGSLRGASFTPDGSRFVTLEADRTARVWDGWTGAPLAVLEGSPGLQSAHAISPDGSLLATASGVGVRLWDIRGNISLAAVPVSSGMVHGAVLFRGGTRLATAGEKGTISIWDAGTFMPLATLSGGSADMSAFAVSPDGGRVAAGDQNGHVRVWDAGTAEPLALVDARESLPVQSLTFSPGGEQLATVSGFADAPILRLWQTLTGEMLLENRVDGPSSPPFVFSPDGAWVAMGNGDKLEIRDGSGGDLIASHDGDGRVEAIAVSPRGSLVAIGCSSGRVTILDARTGTPFPRQPDPEPGATSAIGFSPDGQRLAIGAIDGTVRLWDIAAGQEIAHHVRHDDSVTGIAFSPDGSRMATASRDGTTLIWDGRIAAPLAVLAGHGEFGKYGESLAFHPDGTRILAMGTAGTARMWGVSNAEVHARRLESRKRRERLAPMVEEWFADGLAASTRHLAAAEKTLPREDFDEAAAMVLERAAAIPP